MRKHKSNSLTNKLCRCIKTISKTHKNRDKAAIPICIRSVLGKKGKTIKKFSCRRKFLRMQNIK